MKEDSAKRIEPENTDEFLTLAEAARLLPKRRAGKSISAQSLWRWCAQGFQGVRLEHLRIGRNIYVTRAALIKFGEAIAAQHSAQGSGRKTPSKSKPALRVIKPKARPVK